MPSPNAIEILTGLSVLAAVGSLIVTARHFAKQAKHLSDQLDNQQKQLRLNYYYEITGRVFEINRLFIENPRVRPYFYENKVCYDKALKPQVTAVAEYMLDFFSLIQEHDKFLTSEDLPSIDEWIEYMKDSFRNSPMLRSVLETKKDWYEEGLYGICCSAMKVQLGNVPKPMDMHGTWTHELL